MSNRNQELLVAVAVRSNSAKKEQKMLASFEAKQRASKGSNKGTFLPLEIARRKYGTISEAMLAKKKYVSVKLGSIQYQGMYLVRDSLISEPRAYGELLKYDKIRKKKVPRSVELNTISIKQLPFFSDIEDMFNGIKEIDRTESMVAFKTDGTKVAEDIEEYQYNDGYAVYEPVEYITYKAMFGDRTIVYTRNDKTNRIFNVMTYQSYEMAYRSRNKWLSDMNTMSSVNDRYDVAAISKADRELFISSEVYGEQSLYMS